MQKLKSVSFIVSLLLAAITVFFVVSQEIEKAEVAKQEAKEEIEKASPYNVYYTAYAFGSIFSDVLFGTHEIAETYSRIASERMYGTAYFSPDDGKVFLPEDMAYLSMDAVKTFRKATHSEVTSYFKEQALWSIAELRDLKRPYSVVLLIFIAKIMAGFGVSSIPFLLSLFAKPIGLMLVVAIFSVLAISFLQTAQGQGSKPVNLLKTVPQWQDGERDVSAVLFRLWPKANTYIAATSSGVSLGGGPTWSLSDSLRNFKATISNSLSLDHNGSELVSFKLWNIARGNIGKFEFYSKFFASFPTWKAKPNLLLSANQLTYRIKEGLSIGWRTDNIFSRSDGRWNKTYRNGPAALYQISPSVSALISYSPFGNNSAIMIEANVVF